jgi:CTP-dependent riboflavin kinase
VIYQARAVDGVGRATRMHARRGPALSRLLGADLFPGTLNLRLDRPFLWKGAKPVPVPDALDWGDLDGDWIESQAMIQPVTLSGVSAWAMRLHRSRAPADLVEVLSEVRLRDVVAGWPAELEAP